MRSLLGPLPQRILYAGVHREGLVSQVVRGCVKGVDPKGNGGELLDRLDVGVAKRKGVQACEELWCEVKVASQDFFADRTSAIMLNTIVCSLGTSQ